MITFSFVFHTASQPFRIRAVRWSLNIFFHPNHWVHEIMADRIHLAFSSILIRSIRTSFLLAVAQTPFNLLLWFSLLHRLFLKSVPSRMKWTSWWRHSLWGAATHFLCTLHTPYCLSYNLVDTLDRKSNGIWIPIIFYYYPTTNYPKAGYIVYWPLKVFLDFFS